jgi:hypothetical protein
VQRMPGTASSACCAPTWGTNVRVKEPVVVGIPDACETICGVSGLGAERLSWRSLLHVVDLFNNLTPLHIINESTLVVSASGDLVT